MIIAFFSRLTREKERLHIYCFMLFRIISYGNCFRFALGKSMFIPFHTEKPPLFILPPFIRYNTSRRIGHFTYKQSYRR